jgi:asparagine synthase (glutamine-hydrolysing)
MCGIVGLLSPAEIDCSDWLTRSAAAMRNRGPDDAGFLFWKQSQLRLEQTRDVVAGEYQIAMAHRRLSIIDLSERGRQPMISADGRYALCFNGEIYNYKELREGLIKRGVRFLTETDTEVLLQSMILHGAACLEQLRGMFAFVFIDIDKREYLLARDCFGIKPLYYSHNSHGALAFSSERSALASLPWQNSEYRPQSLYNFLRFGVDDDSRTTLYEGVLQLPPAHYLSGKFADSSIAYPVSYWQPQIGSNLDVSFADAKEQLRSLFLNSVRLHLRSDVPIGAALSGGIDSSAIVCAMRYLEPNLDLHTFTYAPQGFHLNEEKWAHIVATETRAKEHLMDFSSADLVNDLDDLIKTQGGPFGSTSIYAQYKLFKKVSETPVKVMLDGQGGDEILAGYPIYFGAHLALLWKQGRMAEIWQLWKNRQTAAGGHKGAWLMGGAHLLPKPLIHMMRGMMGKELFPAYLNKDWFIDRDVIAGRLESSLDKKNGLPSLLWDTINRSGLPQLLHFEDHNSMRFSIESRVPFLDVDFVNFALSLPGHYHISKDGVMKHLFRETMKDILPAAIFQRKDKVGFHTPGGELLIQAAPWVENILENISPELREIINVNEVMKTWARVKNHELSNSKYQGFWRILCFIRAEQLA